MRITAFDIYRDLLKERSGLIITPDKSYLLESRLGPVAKKWGYPSMDALTLALQGVPDAQLVNDVVEAMTTNETSFFRDSRPFDLFRDKVLPYFEKNRPGKKIRIWCAAASTGQEPYSLSMILKETEAKRPGWRTEILATDISHEVLEQARQGVYSQFEVQRGLPVTLLMKYFTQDDKKWALNKTITSMVKYDYFNLLAPMTALGKFDLIMCRNVLIYFDEKTKRDVLERMANQIEKDSFLFLGGAETVLGITDAFVPLPDMRGVYVRKDSPHLAAAAAAKATAPPLQAAALPLK
jgi:chemotaxis protein methyltransferase CheR